MMVQSGTLIRAKLPSDHQNTKTRLFTGRMPSCRPINGVKELKTTYNFHQCRCNCTCKYLLSFLWFVVFVLVWLVFFLNLYV